MADKKQIEGIDYKNCYYANFNALWSMDEENEDEALNKNEFVLVHAMREHVPNSEFWGGHAFLLNKEHDYIMDFSNQKLIVESKDKLFKQWNIQETGWNMYFEYTLDEAMDKIQEHESYGSWDLLYEDWKAEGWIDYMKNYFIPTFQPIQNKANKERKVV